jgi:hypothetical protein
MQPMGRNENKKAIQDFEWLFVESGGDLRLSRQKTSGSLRATTIYFITQTSQS